jgi:hypothetical protein
MRTLHPNGTVTSIPYSSQASNSARQLTEAVEQSQDMLFTATTVFPFTLFPDTVTIDREKVTVANRTFFRVAEIDSIRIEDILKVTADVGPFFGSAIIRTRYFNTSSLNVRFLWRSDALKLKRILQGYVIAKRNNIDCNVFTAPQLSKLLDDIGQGHPDKDM